MPPTTPERTRRSERGGALPLVAVAVAVAMLSASALVSLGQRAVARADAQTAADMAALAGVAEGEAGAEELARLNGAQLVRFADEEGTIVVEVAQRGVRARARAGLRWSSTPVDS